jgi:hypothetical protein
MKFEVGTAGAADAAGAGGVAVGAGAPGAETGAWVPVPPGVPPCSRGAS